MARLTRREFLQVAGAGAGLGVLGNVGGCPEIPWMPGTCATPASPSTDFSQFEHIVVVMMENRSFDNLFGLLYPSDRAPRGQAFAGVAGQDFSNPIPSYADQAGRGVVPLMCGTAVHDPEPGEEYPHINTQLFGQVLPPENCCRAAPDMLAPYNLPDPLPAPAPMNGFVLDYVNTFAAGAGRMPTYDEYKLIMQCYAPGTLPIITTLARQFALCDHWYCDVPSQTFGNRSFLSRGTSSGFVNNEPFTKWLGVDHGDTIFNRIEACRDRGLSWRIYFDRGDIFSATGLLHFASLQPFFTTRFGYMEQFYEDVRTGRLPSYAFVEPRLLLDPNDLHPGSSILGEGQLASALAGDLLLGQIYEAIRRSDNPDGSNYQNTLLIITFDEHGGLFDHVPPPSATPPDAAARPVGEMGFQFDRLGLRVPTLLISAFTEPGTVVNTTLQHSSVLKTLTNKWGLASLTDRDASANDLRDAFNRAAPRSRADWPAITFKPPPAAMRAASLQRPLNRRQGDLVGLVAAISEDPTRPLPIETVGQAIDYMRQRLPVPLPAL